MIVIGENVTMSHNWLFFRPEGSQDLALMSVRIIFETVILLIELHWNELESSNIAQHEETHSDHYKQD